MLFIFKFYYRLSFYSNKSETQISQIYESLKGEVQLTIRSPNTTTNMR